MHKRTTPNQEVLTAAASMLQPYFPGLTNSTLLDALNNYNVSPIQDERETRPMTKKRKLPNICKSRIPQSIVTWPKGFWRKSKSENVWFESRGTQFYG